MENAYVYKRGICYAGELVPCIKVSKIKILEDGMLLVEFSTGETRLFDVTSLLNKGAVLLHWQKTKAEKLQKSLSCSLRNILKIGYSLIIYFP